MRLWHQQLITLLPDKQLNGQHNECCALRGNGWGRKHKDVDYVFKYGREKLVAYHILVMQERIKRGFYNDPIWFDVNYRGKVCEASTDISNEMVAELLSNKQIYPGHGYVYLKECLENLQTKGITLPVKLADFKF